MIEHNTTAIQHDVPLSDHEVETRFDEMVELLELNNLLDGDLQASKVLELRARRDELLNDILENPAEAFSYEFSMLQRLYEGRTRTTSDGLGTTESQFVTRDSTRQKADLHFRELVYVNGNIEQAVEVPSRDGDQLPFVISLKDETLRIACTVYGSGEYQHREVDPTSHAGERLLREFFSHSIIAGDLMYNRTPEEIAYADEQARSFLLRKLVKENNLS